MPNDLQELRAHYRGYINRLKRELEAATEDVAEDLAARMHDLTGLTDHTLAELRALDHPYARRNAPGILHDDWEVHRQEDDDGDILQDQLRVEHEGRWDRGQVASEIHDDSAHLWYLLQGTVRMRPRDFASAAILQTVGDAEERYRKAFAAAGGVYKDDGNSIIEVDLIPHDLIPAQLPEAE